LNPVYCRIIHSRAIRILIRCTSIVTMTFEINSSRKRPEDFRIMTHRHDSTCHGYDHKTVSCNRCAPIMSRIVNPRIALTAIFARKPSHALGPCRDTWLTRISTCRNLYLVISAVEVTNLGTVWSVIRASITLVRTAKSKKHNAKSRIDRQHRSRTNFSVLS